MFHNPRGTVCMSEKSKTKVMEDALRMAERHEIKGNNIRGSRTSIAQKISWSWSGARAEVPQRQLQSAVLRMVVVPDAERNIERIARQQFGCLQAFCHVPA